MEAKIQRKWALVVAILFVIADIMRLVEGESLLDFSSSYNAGGSTANIGLPLLFFFLAFKKKKQKNK